MPWVDERWGFDGLPSFKGSCAWAAILGLLSLGGCGSPTAQVSGKVVFTDGSPIRGGVRVIRFEPTEDSPAQVRKAAFADLQEDGSFQMLTRQPGDGVFKGKYKVTFTILDSPVEQRSLIDPEFTSAKTTPYSVDVQSDMSGLVFELRPAVR